MRSSLAVIVFALAAVACLVAHIAIFASVLRRGANVANTGVPRPHRAAEIVWALVPALALAVLLTATWSRVRDDASARASEFQEDAR